MMMQKYSKKITIQKECCFFISLHSIPYLYSKENLNLYSTEVEVRIIHYLCMMKRTFQHRVTVSGVSLVVLLAAVALFFFWKRTPSAAVVAALVLCVDVFIVERLIHTTYVFTEDDRLVVSHGRFSRSVTIPLADVTRTEMRRSCFGLVRYVLVEYGSHRMVSVMTENDEAFIKEMCKRTLYIE